jgi:hypothetical protein
MRPLCSAVVLRDPRRAVRRRGLPAETRPHGVTEAYYNFCPKPGCDTGSSPAGGLILDGSGNLYGTTDLGGLGYGVVYEITP